MGAEDGLTAAACRSRPADLQESTIESGESEVYYSGESEVYYSAESDVDDADRPPHPPPLGGRGLGGDGGWVGEWAREGVG